VLREDGKKRGKTALNRETTGLCEKRRMALGGLGPVVSRKYLGKKKNQKGTKSFGKGRKDRQTSRGPPRQEGKFTVLIASKSRPTGRKGKKKGQKRFKKNGPESQKKPSERTAETGNMKKKNQGANQKTKRPVNPGNQKPTWSSQRGEERKTNTRHSERWPRPLTSNQENDGNS